jgi:uncharacterized protein (TIGR00375 family)
MLKVYADFHIHIGKARGKSVKITASRELNLQRILFQDAPEKGLDIVGIVDAGTLPVYQEIEAMLANGDIRELHRGGFLARNGVVFIAACELESLEGVHWIIYLPHLEKLKEYQKFIRNRVKNLDLSTQKVHINARELVNLSLMLEGILCPAHAFTPHKGAYGAWVDRLEPVLGRDLQYIKVLELGLSSDTDMADTIAETRRFNFLSNSDAHSPANIAREYNLLRIAEKNFEEIRFSFENINGRRIMANFGMDPQLGKYHRSFCQECLTIAEGNLPVFVCQNCGSDRLVNGVYDRIAHIRDYNEPRHPISRPPYHYRVPLRQLPGVGPKMYKKLIQFFGSEIEILENADIEKIKHISGENIALMIKSMRTGRLPIIPGGGGYYGKVKKHNS